MSAKNINRLGVARMKAWETGGMPLSYQPPSSVGFVNSTSIVNLTTGELENNATYRNLWQEVLKSDLDRLDNADCIREYSSSPLINSRKHLILVVVPDKGQANSSDLGLYQAQFKRKNKSGQCNRDGYEWICEEAFGTSCHWGDGCSKQARSIDPGNWKTFQNAKPVYCLSEKVNQTCTLRFSSNLAWVVICFNGSKLLLLLVCCLPKGPLSKEQPLLTVGDTISSFLREKDMTTPHLSAMGASDLALWTGVKTSKSKMLTKETPKWRHHRMLRTVPRRRWIFLTILQVIPSVSIPGANLAEAS
jgi:hypothetical protein